MAASGSEFVVASRRQGSDAAGTSTSIERLRLVAGRRRDGCCASRWRSAASSERSAEAALVRAEVRWGGLADAVGEGADVEERDSAATNRSARSTPRTRRASEGCRCRGTTLARSIRAQRRAAGGAARLFVVAGRDGRVPSRPRPRGPRRQPCRLATDLRGGSRETGSSHVHRRETEVGMTDDERFATAREAGFAAIFVSPGSPGRLACSPSPAPWLARPGTSSLSAGRLQWSCRLWASPPPEGFRRSLRRARALDFGALLATARSLAGCSGRRRARGVRAWRGAVWAAPPVSGECRWRRPTGGARTLDGDGCRSSSRGRGAGQSFEGPAAHRRSVDRRERSSEPRPRCWRRPPASSAAYASVSGNVALDHAQGRRRRHAPPARLWSCPPASRCQSRGVAHSSPGPDAIWF